MSGIRLIALTISISCCVASSGQTLSKQSQPNAEEQAEMLSHLRTYVEAQRQFPSQLACTQRTAAGSGQTISDLQSRNLITIDFARRESQLVTARESNVDVNGMTRDLFAADARISFDRFAGLQGKTVAVFRGERNSQDGPLQADIYADPDSGRVSRITIRSLHPADSFGHVYCWQDKK